MANEDVPFLDVPSLPPTIYLTRQVRAALETTGFYQVSGSLAQPYLAQCTPGAVRISTVRVRSELDEIEVAAVRRDFGTIRDHLRTSGGNITVLIYGPGEIAVRHRVMPGIWPTVEGPVGSIAFQIEAN